MIAKRIYTAISMLLVIVFIPIHAQAKTLAQASDPACPPFDPAFVQDQKYLQSLPPECAKAYRKLMWNTNNQATTQDVSSMSVGGPDAFGYTYNDTVPYGWVAGSTNTGISGDDEISGLVNIGFIFPFYGINYSQLYFNTNGGITFGGGSYDYGSFGIPDTSTPNNLIAPFWNDLVVGSPYNSGAIFSSQGGIAPNRYFILEWRAVTTYYGSSPFSFEAILYENGDIVTQLQSLPSYYLSTVGIENSAGDEGLQYQKGSSGLSAPKAIRFYYPTAATARVLVSPLKASSFAAVGGTTAFALTVNNNGSIGTDTYDLTSVSAWPVSLYAADGITPLTDNDSDGTVDTGSVAQGSNVIITAKVAIPGGATVGAANSATITAVSSLNTGKSKTASLQSVVPAPFAQIYEDNADGGAMRINLVKPNIQVTKKVSPDGAYYNMAVASAPNGNFVYVWRTFRTVGSLTFREIWYTLLDRNGNTLRAVGKLTDYSGASMSTYDYLPSVAVAPNGTIGIVWQHILNTNDIYFATLDASGNLLTGPTNITNNISSMPEETPTIAASDDNCFIIGWRERTINASNIWYAVRDTAGASVFPATALTSDNLGDTPVPILNSLTDGKAIMTWRRSTGSFYAVINSNGAIAKSATSLNTGTAYDWSLDAVLLPNGKVAIAWPTATGVRFAILNSSYVLESGPTSANTPDLLEGYNLSVTTDSASHVIMTWRDAMSYSLFYALGDSTGAFITPPIIYKTSAIYISTSMNGQGNLPYYNSTISGNAGIAGATLSYTDGTPKTATSLVDGSYSFQVPNNWSGTVTPSHTCFTFSPANRPYSSVITDQTAQNYTPTFSIASGCADVNVLIAAVNRGRFGITPHGSTRQSFTGTNNGPVQIASTNAVSIIGAERVIYNVNGVNTSFSEMMGLPNSQLSTTYWLPWYNNVDLDTQLRFGNVSGSTATVHVFIGGVEMVGSPFSLLTGGSTRVSFAGVNDGPVKVISDVNIVAAERVIYKVNGTNTSFTEMMALPDGLLNTTYWLPWYNNVDLDTQLRFGNVSGSTATVHVFIGGAEMTGSPFTLLTGQSTRVSFAGVNNGPVKVISDVNIVAAERVIYKVNGTNTSFSEMMALPDTQLSTTYWMPWYNNVDLDTQLRFGNVSGSTATVHVFIGGAEMTGSPFTLLTGQSTRVSFAGVNNGPVKVLSDVNIVTAERVIYKVNGVNTSFSEMMGLPNSLLNTTYWLPWYNNVDLDTQLRFGVP